MRPLILSRKLAQKYRISVVFLKKKGACSVSGGPKGEKKSAESQICC